ncbi:MAG TPA: DUF1822 family protein [Kamptonema sp.]|nr:DUF1822 family protein [Kamptonema sp.]
MFQLNQLQPFYSDNSYRLRLTIDEADRETAWQKAQHHSNPISRYNAYLNATCLPAFLIWLSEWLVEETLPQPSVWHDPNLASIWEVVNGTAIEIGETRLVLIPSDEGDLEELSVPQEWVDIPNWSADYYLAAQVNLDGDEDELWMEVWGFATHSQLKNESRYNGRDRTYSLAIEELTESLTVIQITLGLNLQADVSPLPSLSKVESAKMLEILGDSSVYSPRLKVPFEKWAAFLANDEYRQHLYEKRLNLAPVLSTAIQVTENLLQRVNNYFQAGWQTVAEIIDNLGNSEPDLAYAIEGYERYRDGNSGTHNKIPTLIELLHDRRNQGNQWRAAELLGRVEPGNVEAIAALTQLLQTNPDDNLRRQAAVSLGKIDPKNAAAGVRVGKIIELNIKLDTVRVVLVVTLLPEGSDRTTVHLRVCPVRSRILAPNLQLIILDEDSQTFWEEQADNATENLQYQFMADINDYFQVKVSLQGVSATEDFTV